MSKALIRSLNRRGSQSDKSPPVARILAYRVQKNRALGENDKTLEAIFHLVGRDEAAHAGFYRDAVTFELSEDREGTLADLSHVIANFRMPGDGLIPNYLEKLKVGGGGISARHFFQHGVLPTLNSRSELKALPNPTGCCETRVSVEQLENYNTTGSKSDDSE